MTSATNAYKYHSIWNAWIKHSPDTQPGWSKLGSVGLPSTRCRLGEPLQGPRWGKTVSMRNYQRVVKLWRFAEAFIQRSFCWREDRKTSSHGQILAANGPTWRSLYPDIRKTYLERRCSWSHIEHKVPHHHRKLGEELLDPDFFGWTRNWFSK